MFLTELREACGGLGQTMGSELEVLACGALVGRVGGLPFGTGRLSKSDRLGCWPIRGGVGLWFKLGLVSRKPKDWSLVR